MSKPELDIPTFQKRLKTFLTYWKNDINNTELGFNGSKAILVINDKLDEDIPYSKTSTIQNWLFGYEFTKTILVLTFDKLFIATSTSKAKVISGLTNLTSPLPVEVFTFGKDEKELLSTLELFANKALEGLSELPLGVFPKDKKKSPFSDTWDQALKNINLQPSEVDITLGVALALAPKDDIELKLIKNASKSSAQILKNYFVDVMTSAIDQEKKITHEKLSDQTENVVFEDKELKKAKLPSDLDLGLLDWSYTPIVQSNGNYDLKPSAISDNKYLSSGVIICSLGIRYKSYCSNIGRTFLIDATPTQEKNYAHLLDLQRYLLNKIKPGVTFGELYNLGLNFVKENRPELEQNFVRSVGFVTGIEFRESKLVIQPKSNYTMVDNLVICLSVGFHNLVDGGDKKKYSLLLIDTVKVGNDGAVVLTDALREATDVTYFLNNDDDDNKKKSNNSKPDTAKGSSTSNDRATTKKKPEPSTSNNNKPPINSAILKSKFRSEDQEETPEQKRREHQRELFTEKQEDGLRRFKGDGNAYKDNNQESFKHFESYKRDTAMPKEAKSLGIVVDQRGESIIVPINGLAVPFHISTLKNASKNDEGEYVYLRLNFLTPGQGVGKKDDLPFPDPNAHFLRALTFRSSDTFRLSEIYRKINELRKEIAKKEIEKKDMADLIQQDKLRLTDGRVPRLPDVFVRPPPEGKRMAGELEIHTNGLRYKHPRANQNIDVLFTNIKHLFFQPCENELLVLIHVHLNDPIMIGKKKTKDIQFYREASDVQFDETGNRRRQSLYGDEDEIGAEMEERRRIKELNDEFKVYATKISDAARGKIEVETPFREISFQGVPSRSNVNLMPTGDCLVHLSDPPYLIITLSEIEIVHMERVQFGLKNFDLVFVFKDFSKVPIHINSIPMKQLDGVKEWLDSVDVVFTEGPVNLNWNAIMKTIRDDPVTFFEDGGWGFLGEKGDDSGEPSEESASEFEIDSEELMQESSESDYDEDSGNNNNGGSDEEEFDDEDDEIVGGSDEEEAEDWDELEAKAARDDKRKRVPEPSTVSGGNRKVPSKKRR